MVNRLLVVIAALASLSACEGRPQEYGVAVFSTDTIPVMFTVTLTGSLALSLRSEGFQMRPDKSLVLTTPAQMTVARAPGTALIESMRGGKLAVTSIGVADSSTAEGRAVMLTIPPDKRAVILKAEKP